MTTPRPHVPVPQPQIPTVKWLTVAQTAAKLGLSKMSIYRLIDSGALPAFKFGPGRAVRINPADLNAYVQSCRVIPAGLRDES
jgi:excisionase family DNA binding protein